MDAPPSHRRSLAVGLLVQFAFVTAAVLVYFSVRGLTQGQEAQASANARDLLDLERVVGLDFEVAAQELIIGRDVLVTLTNWVYIWAHWPVLIAALVWLFVRHGDEYVLLRNAIFVSGLIGMVIFAVYPVTPPRLLSAEYIDTVTDRSNSYRVLQPPGLVNKFAAFPSLHFGWNLIVGISLWRTAPSIGLRAFGAISPLLMAAAVVLTANHYTIDVIGGAVVALTGLIAAHGIARRRPVQRSGDADPDPLETVAA